VPKDTRNQIILSDCELDLITLIRTTECANIQVYVQNFIPIRVKKEDSIILGKGKIKLS
jgi:hypothetical protein